MYKATAPKNGVEFRQDSIGTIRSSLATSYDVWRRRQFSTNQRPRNYLTQTNSQRIHILSGPALRAAPAKILTKAYFALKMEIKPRSKYICCEIWCCWYIIWWWQTKLKVLRLQRIYRLFLMECTKIGEYNFPFFAIVGPAWNSTWLEFLQFLSCKLAHDVALLWR